MRISDWSSDVCSSDLLRGLWLLWSATSSSPELTSFAPTQSQNPCISVRNSPVESHHARISPPAQSGWCVRTPRVTDVADFLQCTPKVRKSTRLNSSH